MSINFPQVKIFSTLFIAILSACVLSAQSGPPSIGVVIGIIQDSVGNAPIEYAAVAVMSAKDSLVKGGSVTDKNGAFQIRQLPPGKYMLRVTFMGYTTKYSAPFMLSPQQTQFDAGIIKLKSAGAELNTVVIEEDRADYSNSIDKKVYDVGQNITATGGTATDVLQNVPSVTVDVDGKVSLRGSENVTILIDGKPSGITGNDRQAALAQIPASMIDRIEVVTNPSAKYDAQGTAGIINIVTKKDGRKGFNASVNAGIGTNNKYNGGLNFNNRGEKINVFAQYTYRYEDRWMRGDGQQHTFTSDTNFYFQNKPGSFMSSGFHSGRAGFDWSPTPYQTLSVAAGLTARQEHRNDSTVYTFLNSEQVAFDGFSRRAATDEYNTTGDVTLDYRKTFPCSKRLLTAAGAVSYNTRQVGSAFKLNLIGYNLPAYQLTSGNNEFLTSALQIDYTHPLSDSFKIETGIKAGLRDNDNRQLASMYDYANEIYFDDSRFADRFTFSEYIYAGYVQAAAHLGKFDMQAGLRLEYTDMISFSESVNDDFRNTYLNLFPSATVRYTPKDGIEMQLGYSRRLNRPSNGQLNPFLDYSDSLNIRTGNPYLQPEFIDALEFNFNKYWKALTLNTTLYYRHTDNAMSFMRTYDTLTGVAIMGPVNFESSDNVGLDLVLRLSLGKKGNIMWSSSAFQSTVVGGDAAPGRAATFFGWNTRISATYKVIPSTAIQLTGMYSSRYESPIGSFWMPGAVDIGVRHDFMKGKATASVNLSDIFNTRKMYITNFNTGYEMEIWRQRESRILMLNLTWRFGSGDDFQKKKSSVIPSGDDAPMGF